MQILLPTTAATAVAATATAAALLLWQRKAAAALIPPPEPAQPALTTDEAGLRKLLSVIEDEILPKTREQVALGNKVFGAAILDGELRTVIADTNHETICPLYHGEVYAIEQWSALPAEKKCPPSESVFLATHEPCCLCISAIVWAGFKRVFFLFPYETTRDQGIPHDLNIMYELWRVPRYQRRNKFCAAAGLLPLIGALPDASARDELNASVERISAAYDALAAQYHSEKAANPKNTMAFN